MVCPRCIMTVSEILEKEKIKFANIELGYADLKEIPEEQRMKKLAIALEGVGFELIQTRNDKLISTIKSLIISEVYDENYSGRNLSEILSNALPYDYSHITHLFSQAEGKSIQQYYQSVKMERVKELLHYDEYSIAQVADMTGFSTAAYLSTTFKKAIGMTPSEYRNLSDKDRRSLDSV